MLAKLQFMQNILQLLNRMCTCEGMHMIVKVIVTSIAPKYICIALHANVYSLCSTLLHNTHVVRNFRGQGKFLNKPKGCIANCSINQLV